MKNKIIAASALMVFSVFSAYGCTEKNEDNVTDITDTSVSVTTETKADISLTVTSPPVSVSSVSRTTAYTSVTSVSETERDYVRNPEKKFFSEIDMSRKFYGYENKDSGHLRGTGPEKPESVSRPAYLYYISDAEILDPELKSLVSDFLESSKQDILYDYEKYCMFRCNDPEKSELSMTFTEKVDIVNNYCFVTVKYRDKNFTGTYFEARCGYFDIGEKKQIEFSDLFYRDSDFMRGVNKSIIDSVFIQDLWQGDLEDKLKPDFNGLCKEMALMVPDVYDIDYSNTHDSVSSGFSLGLICPDINPYGKYYGGMSMYDICQNSIILNDPEFIPEDIAPGCKRVIFDDYACKDIIKYDEYKENPKIKCPVECDFLSEDEIRDMINVLSQDIHERYGEYIRNDMDYLAEIQYRSDFDGFAVSLRTEAMYLGREYYRRDTHEKFTLEEMCSAYIGDDWESLVYDSSFNNILLSESFDRDGTEFRLENIRSSDGDTLRSTRTVHINYNDQAISITADFIMNDEYEWVRADR